MKKAVLTTIFCLLCLFALTGIAAAEKVADVYSTDILAYVHGQPIDSYNIGGRTCIIAEDLDFGNYGYSHEYNDETRHLSVRCNFGTYAEPHGEIPRGKTGSIIGEVYKTDITVTFNGIPITGYNIGGRTAICIEELGEPAGNYENHYGYSPYLHSYIWNPYDKTVSLNRFVDNTHQAILGLKVSRMSYTYCDDTLYLVPDDSKTYASIEPSIAGEPKGAIEGAYTYYYTEDFANLKYKVSDLFVYDNLLKTKTKVGLRVCVHDVDSNHDRTYLQFDDPQLMLYLAKEAKTPQKSYEEAVSYLEGLEYTLAEKIENDDFTVWHYITENGDHGIYAAKKTGGLLHLNTYPANKTIGLKWDKEPHELIVTEYPFGGPHGITTANNLYHLNELDFS